jgi:hypothetical protein
MRALTDIRKNRQHLNTDCIMQLAEKWLGPGTLYGRLQFCKDSRGQRTLLHCNVHALPREQSESRPRPSEWLSMEIHFQRLFEVVILSKYQENGVTNVPRHAGAYTGDD